MNHKIQTLLGFAQKAGKMVSGETGCELSVKKGRVHLIIIAQDASLNTKEHVKSLCRIYNTPWIEWGSKELIGTSLGKAVRSIAGILDQHFAREIQKLVMSSNE